MFAYGEKNAPPALAAAKASYAKLKSRLPNDARIDYAYAIVLANQHKYVEAANLLDRHAKQLPPDCEFERTRIWLLLQQRRYPQALDEAVQLVRHLGAEPSVHQDARRQAIEMLGTVFGYVELVRPTVVDAKVRNEWKNAALSELSESNIELFDASRQLVADRLANLQREQQQRQEQAAKQIEQKQEQAKAALEKDQKSLANERTAVDVSQEQLRESGRELALIETQLRTLGSDRVKLAAQITYVQTQFDTTLNQSSPIPARGPTSTVSGANAISLSNTLVSLSRQAVQMDRKILELRRRAAELGAKGEEETQNLAESEATLRKAERRAAALEKQLRRSEAKDSKTPAKPVAMTSKMMALSTYWPFPYEEERQRVLAWFADE